MNFLLYLLRFSPARGLAGLVLAATVGLFFAGAAQAGNLALGACAAHGEESSQAYDLFLQYTFDPWYENETLALGPLVSAGASLWEREDGSIFGGNLNAGLLLRFFGGDCWSPYLSGTFGIVELSDDVFHNLDLGTREQFRTRGGAGVSFGERLRHDLELNVTHYSNAGMNHKNDGYDTVGLSYRFGF